MHTCAPGSAANDAARRWSDTIGSALAIVEDRQGTGMLSAPVVSAESFDAPVSNNSLGRGSGRLAKNSAGPGRRLALLTIRFLNVLGHVGSEALAQSLDALLANVLRIFAASELFDAPVSNNSPISALWRPEKNSVGARPAPNVFASSVFCRVA